MADNLVERESMAALTGLKLLLFGEKLARGLFFLLGVRCSKINPCYLLIDQTHWNSASLSYGGYMYRSGIVLHQVGVSSLAS